MLSRVAVVLALGLASSASLLSPLSSSARQIQIDSNDLPAACRSGCEGPINVLNTYNGNFDLLCKQDVLHGYSECMSCLIDESAGAVSTSQAQSAVDGLVDGCNGLGYNVPSETISGGSGGGSSPTSSSPSGTSSGFPTTTSPMSGGDNTGSGDDEGGLSGQDGGDGALSLAHSGGLASAAIFAGAAFVLFA